MSDSQLSKELVQSFYSHLKEGNPEGAFSLLADDITWSEAEGNPLADKNPYTGAAAIGDGVFGRLAEIFEEFAAVPDEFIADGNRVIVTARYYGTHKKSGTPLNCQAVHSWTVSGDKIIQFQQYADTEPLARLS